jgi:hypothetical protein
MCQSSEVQALFGSEGSKAEEAMIGPQEHLAWFVFTLRPGSSSASSEETPA